MAGRYSIVAFDVVGVLTASAYAALFAYEAELGYPRGALARLFDEAVDEASTEITWNRLERGEIAAAAYWRCLEAAAAARSTPVSGPELERRYIEVLRTRQEPMLAFAKEVREAGWRTAILTNNILEYRDHWHRALAAHEFDWAFDSCEMGKRKPEARFFEQVLAGTGVAPAEMLFLDDSIENIDAALGLGITAIHVDDVPRAIDAARAALGRGPAGERRP